MAYRFTLVPSELFSEESAREILSEVVHLEEGEPLSFQGIPSLGLVMVYAGGSRPPLYDMMMSLCKIREYNKIMVGIAEGMVNIVIAQGERLLFCNAFKAADFTTAEYYLFSALRKFQINPEVSTVYFTTEISAGQRSSLYNYFKGAEVLR